MRRLLLIPVAIVSLAVPAPARDAGPRSALRPTSALLEAHLQQAQELRPGPSRPGTDRGMARLEREVAATSSAWQGRWRRSANAGPFVEGIDRDVKERAARWVRDSGDLTAALASAPTLPIVLAAVAHRNPEVQAARERWQASLRQFGQASFLEGLLVPYRAFVRELDTKVGPQTHREMTEQTFPFPAALSYRGALIDIRADIERLKYETVLRKAMNDAARSYLQVRYTVEALDELTASRALLEQMEAVTRAHLQVGTAAQADALKAQTALAMLVNDIELLRQQRESDVAQANAMMGLLAVTPWGKPAPADLRPSGNAERIPGLARTRAQEVQQSRRMVDEARAMVRMAEIMVLPGAASKASLVMPSVGAEAGPTRSTMSTFPERTEVTTERAPLGANAAYIDELRVRVRASQRDLDAAIVRQDAVVKSAAVRVERAKLSLATYRDQVVPRARQTLDTLHQRYTTGGTPFIEYLDAARTYRDGLVKLAEARRDLALALVELQDASGGTAAALLPRR